MIRHIALFKWNDDVTPAHIAATATALSGLPEVIDTILDYRHAADIGINQANFDYGVTADFALRQTALPSASVFSPAPSPSFRTIGTGTCAE